MNSFSRQSSKRSQSLDDGAKLELQEDQRESNATFSDDGTSTIPSEEFAVESPIEFSGECGSTSAENRPTNKKPAHWSRSAIYYLIGTYKRLARDEEYGKTCFGSMAIWTEVSRRLQNRGFPCTPEQCRTKWTLLKKLYQHIRNGTQLRRFEFVEHIHDYYKDPLIEELLVDVRKSTAPNRRGGRPKKKMSTPSADSGIRIDNGRNKAQENVENENLTQVHIEPFYSTEVQNCIDQAEKWKNLSFQLEVEQSDVEVVDPVLFNETHEDLTDEVLQSEETGFDCLSPEVQTSDFIREFKKIVAAQDKRRDERHKEKMRIFREYCDRFLAQQHEAIMLHKRLIERLISSL